MICCVLGVFGFSLLFVGFIIKYHMKFPIGCSWVFYQDLVVGKINQSTAVNKSIELLVESNDVVNSIDINGDI